MCVEIGLNGPLLPFVALAGAALQFVQSGHIFFGFFGR